MANVLLFVVQSQNQVQVPLEAQKWLGVSFRNRLLLADQINQPSAFCLCGRLKGAAHDLHKHEPSLVCLWNQFHLPHECSTL